MITVFRKNIKFLSLVIWVGIFAFVAGGAVLYMAGPFRKGDDVAIRIGDVKITAQDYQKIYNRYYRTYSQLLGGKFNRQIAKEIGFNKQVQDSIINRTILAIQAKKDGIKISDVELAAAIENNPHFMQNGHFSKALYNSFLQLNNMTKKEYEDSLRKDLLVRKEAQKLIGNINVSEDEIKSSYLSEYGRRSYQYAVVDAAKYKKGIKISKSELTDYYNKYKEQFRVPQKVVIKYIDVDIAGVEKNIKVTKKEERKFYNLHKSQFIKPAVVHARHILIAKDKDGSYKNALKKAERIYKKLKAGASFSKLAKKYSDDPGSRASGGDLGYIEKSQLVKPFADAAFSLKIGQISKPVKTRFGYHIIEVLDRKAASVKPFEDVEGKIGKSLKALKAYQNLFNDAKRAQIAWRDAKGDDNLKGYRILTSKPFSYDGKLFGSYTGNIYQQAVMLANGKVSSPIQAGSKRFIVFKKVKTIKSYIPKLEAVKSEVKAAVIKLKANQIAKKIEEKAVEIAKKEGVYKASKRLGLAYKTTGLVSESEIESLQLGCLPQKLEQLKKGEIAVCSNENLYNIVAFKNKSRFDKKDYLSKKAVIRRQLLQQKESDILQKKIAELKKGIEIKINKKFTESI